MPRAANDHVQQQPADKRPLSHVAQIEDVLASIPEPMPSGSSVAAWAAVGAASSAAPFSGRFDWSSMPHACTSSALLPPAADEQASNADGKQTARAQRKAHQVESFALVLAPLLQQLRRRCPQLTLVDFGCGTGNLLLPLAHHFSAHRFVGVDMKPEALRLLRERADAARLHNVSTWQGMMEGFDRPFDVALALHACGNATDVSLQLAEAARAVFVVSPCCVGKLKFSMSGGSSFHAKPLVWTPQRPGDKPDERTPITHAATQAAVGAASPCSEAEQKGGGGVRARAAQLPPLQHPRSAWLRAALPQPDAQFKIVARVADAFHAPSQEAALPEAQRARAAVSQRCKRFVELDRCQAAREAGYAAGLFKVLGAQDMAKNDLLVGVPCAGGTERQRWDDACLDLLHPPSSTCDYCARGPDE